MRDPVAARHGQPSAGQRVAKEREVCGAGERGARGPLPAPVSKRGRPARPRRRHRPRARHFRVGGPGRAHSAPCSPCACAAPRQCWGGGRGAAARPEGSGGAVIRGTRVRALNPLLAPGMGGWRQLGAVCLSEAVGVGSCQNQRILESCWAGSIPTRRCGCCGVAGARCVRAVGHSGSQNCLGWKGPQELTQSNPCLHLEQITQERVPPEREIPHPP